MNVPLPAVVRIYPAYRSDGWPLCPWCGTDTLQSVLPAVVKNQPRAPRPTDEMRCRTCTWNGALPARSEAEQNGLMATDR